MEGFAPKNILCPVDLSPASPLVLRWADLIAQKYGAKLEVLLAESPEYPAYFLPGQEDELARQAENRRAALQKHLEKTVFDTVGSATSSEIRVVEGHPVQAILRRMETDPPDLIVMGSHGRSGIARMRLGSVAETVVREARMPTLVVRSLGSQPAPAGISRVLCPAKFTDHGHRCVDFSAAIAAKFGAQLVVVHSAEHETANLEAARKELCRLISADARQTCEVVEVVRQGSAAEQILLAAREHSVDLIVIAAQHQPFLEFTTLGTTAERIMRHADSAVLILPGGMGE